MITEQSIIAQIHSDTAGNISIQRADQVLKDGVVIATSFHRHVLIPGADLSGQDPKVQSIAAATWTPELMSAHTATIVTQATAETAERNAAKDASEAAKAASESAKSSAEAATVEANAATAALTEANTRLKAAQDEAKTLAE